MRVSRLAQDEAQAGVPVQVGGYLTSRELGSGSQALLGETCSI